jgi:hypothetical protein
MCKGPTQSYSLASLMSSVIEGCDRYDTFSRICAVAKRVSVAIQGTEGRAGRGASGAPACAPRCGTAP